MKCGRLEHRFLRVQCEACHHEKLVAFSCKRRGFCPSCGARRMADSAAHLVDAVLPKRPIGQWVLSVPFPLRFLFATNPGVMSQVLAIVHRGISTFLIHHADMTVKSGAQSGAVTLIQRFGRSGVPAALNLNPHFHMLYLNGVYDRNAAQPRATSGRSSHPPVKISTSSPTPSHCGPVRVIVEASNRSMEDPDVIQKILKHLGLDRESQPHIRAPPDTLFDYPANLF